ncbi:MAG: ATPase, T2SS/T4P/T4SS family [Promethearchaeota archaeon]|jgi:type IV secretory pathway ATPase VirB11/archaellum biosynthesis ATPase
MILKNVSYFQENENLAGKRELILFIDCKKCILRKENLDANNRCLSCLFYNLFLHKNSNISTISWNDFLIESHQIEILLEYVKKVKKINKIVQKIVNVRTNKCRFEEFRCEFSPNFTELQRIKESDYYDPLYIYKVISELDSNFKKTKLNNSICSNCLVYLEKLLKNILGIFNNLRIIQYFKDYHNKDVNFYDHFFSKAIYIDNNTHEFHEYDSKESELLLKIYNIGKYNSFQVNIHQRYSENEKFYRVKILFEEDKEKDYIEKILKDIKLNIESAEFERVIPLETLINLYKDESIEFLRAKYNLPELEIKRIGLLAALRKLQLDKLFPLLVDDLVEEIFLDTPYDNIYVNHQKFGRCRTIIKLTSIEIERLKTMARLYSGKRLDYMNPSIKLVIKNEYFYCRFGIDIDPIQIHNFALDIRKLNRNIFTIQDLLKNGTLDSIMAAFLYFNVLRKTNITITGETDTGKTTLINALDLLTPKEFRKIYVENVTESLKQLDFGKHQLKYQVDSLDDNITQKYSKSNIIKTLLHRTPDIIYLGEILTKEESEAMFHCLAAGLKGFQTIHGSNVDSLMNRFLHHFDINESCLNDLDLIILMKKEQYKRRILSISEVNKGHKKSDEYYDSIFNYDPLSKTWKLSKPLYETGIIIEFKKNENLPKEYFMSIIKIYKEIFEFLSEINLLDKFELIELFHKISYHSFISIDSLNQFWIEWKKKRDLNL